MATKPTHVMAIDQGTTGSTVLVFDRRGRIARTRLLGVPPALPEARLGRARRRGDLARHARGRAPGAAEGQGQGAGARRASASPTSARRRSCGTAAPAQPVHRAIVWQDRRTADVCARPQARRRRGRGARRRPASSSTRTSPRTKVAWILDNVRGARERAARGDLVFGTIDSWLVWKLTGGKVHVTDPTNASRTLLFNIHGRGWDAELLRMFDVPMAMVPEVRPSSGVIAETEPRLLGAPVLIAGIAGDQQAALFGQGCFAPGMVKNTYGTGCFVLMQTGSEAVTSERGLVTTIACGAGGAPTYALEGSVFIAGAVDAVAARRPQDPQDGGGKRGAGPQGEVDARRLRRAGVRRARRAVLGSRGARRDRRAHARRRARARRARRARVARVPDPRRRRDDGRRRQQADRRAPRRRRRRRPTTS